jgi:hypothetical protein
MDPLLRSRPAYEVFGDDDRLDHQGRGTPNWREIAALLGGIEGAKKRARLVLDSFELTIMLKRLEGMALQEIATKLRLPVSTVHEHCRMHGGTSPGAPKGNKNALKHGRYSGQAIARRRSISELLRLMKALAGTGRR